MASPRNSSESAGAAVANAIDAAADEVSRMRLSMDGEAVVNGLKQTDSARKPRTEGNGLDTVQSLQEELERTKEEKEQLATQYRNLLDKLTAMRTTLGNKLKQDAEELDRREQLVQHLTAQNEDLSATIETLKAEVIASNDEAERKSRELEAMRSRTLEQNAHEAFQREQELRELHAELEKFRMERDEWERDAQQERTVSEEAKASLLILRRDLELEREARERDVEELEKEREKCANLQSVLEDFQSGKESEMRLAVQDYESQLRQSTQSLAEYKSRALRAEAELQETTNNSRRTSDLEKELKEKNLLIGKLRHEAVIINEHLMEALRRLRKNSSDTNVDRRLVTNVLLSFLNTPRADSKRFEMLSLLASILSWTDAEREKAGLQRVGAAPPRSSSSSSWGISSSSKEPVELDRKDETESFSQMWVEFLLKEAAQGTSVNAPSPAHSHSSLPDAPMYSPGGSLRSPGGSLRVPSLSAAMSSSPNLTMPPSRKPSHGS